MNAGELATLRTDFNSVDDGGLLTATNPVGGFISELRDGAAVHIVDGEGNSCIGWIVRKKSPLFYVRPEWSSWVSTELVAISGGQATPALPQLQMQPDSQTAPSGAPIPA